MIDLRRWQALAATCAGACRDLLFPPACLACGVRLEDSRPPLVCPSCLQTIRPIRHPFCLLCGEPFTGTGPGHLCERCLRGNLHFDCARAAFVFTGSMVPLLHGLKYGRRTLVLDTLAALVQENKGLQDLVEPDLVVPVPLHSGRLRQRGFNQSVEVARHCLSFWRDRLCCDLLRRRRDTVAQALLPARERLKNVQGVFEAQTHADLSNSSILLVDDVMTTGATLDACAAALRAVGAKKVQAWTLARTP